jgi:hypothetical protein
LAFFLPLFTLGLLLRRWLLRSLSGDFVRFLLGLPLGDAATAAALAAVDAESVFSFCSRRERTSCKQAQADKKRQTGARASSIVCTHIR